MNHIDWLLAISAFMIGNCILFATYCFYSRSRDQISLNLLGVFLLALAIRVGKSVVTLMAPDHMDVLTAIGIVAMYVIGPALYLFFRSSFSNNSVNNKLLNLHFIPAGAISLILLFAFKNENLVYQLYLISVALMFGYGMLATWVWWQYCKHTANNKDKKEWGGYFLLAVFAIWMSLIGQLTFETYSAYLTATLLATAIMFAMAIYTMTKKRHLSIIKAKPLNDHRLMSVAVKIENLFTATNAHLQESITIDVIADKLNLQPYLVSQAINASYGKSLPELVSEYRIEHAKKLLTAEEQEMNIKSIAFESGFTTISAFYSTFKKITKMTPKEFRQSRN
ncbi:MAG: helix-turn-helix transcriptional regulator [Cyclobacteriaceae bacterium]